ncbi:6-phosphogluconolactonase [uncultured Microbacterium sp.]|uniref:6-phosphogluconolactonase n=1 Tax=uncultured Microbacterium sp. TaxID=191216 RepID=UPI0025E58753|nr:6-phosphogluconolactonase [uncultured Microbacterium sp.]
MNDTETKLVYATAADVAAKALDVTLEQLDAAITERGEAAWALAGGSSPLGAYRLLADRDTGIDWSAVTGVIGDERHVPLDDPNSNWGQISAVLLGAGPTGVMRQVRPNPAGSVEQFAADYAEQLGALVPASGIAPRLDVVWLGVGEDGHTLSLFPGHPDAVETGELVRAVHDSPKPPPERFTLALTALTDVGTAIIFATGAAKREALARAAADDLPIARVAAHIASHGGSVIWLFDEAAHSG